MIQGGATTSGWASAPAQLSVFVALGLLFVLDKIFKFEALLPLLRARAAAQNTMVEPSGFAWRSV